MCAKFSFHKIPVLSYTYLEYAVSDICVTEIHRPNRGLTIIGNTSTVIFDTLHTFVVMIILSAMWCYEVLKYT